MTTRPPWDYLLIDDDGDWMAVPDHLSRRDAVRFIEYECDLDMTRRELLELDCRHTMMIRVETDEQWEWILGPLGLPDTLPDTAGNREWFYEVEGWWPAWPDGLFDPLPATVLT